MLKAKSIVMGSLLLLSATSMAQSLKTTLSAEIYGYQREMVYFDCVQSPLIREEFHTNPGEEHLYSFQTDQLVAMIVNGRTTLLLAPGDSLHAVIRYDGKNVESLELEGTPRAVEQNNIYQAVADMKRDMRYKSQLLACAVVDVKPANRIADSRTLLAKTAELVKQAGNKLSTEAANYIMAEQEGLAYTSFMEYPTMYAETRNLPIADQGIGDYWALMDGVTLRSDAASLSSPEYCAFLMQYLVYEKSKQAHAKGDTYTRPETFEKIYAELASFFSGPQRDAVLYNLICNFIRGGKDIERVDSILKDYKQKYNLNKHYVEIIDTLLQ